MRSTEAEVAANILVYLVAVKPVRLQNNGHSEATPCGKEVRMFIRTEIVMVDRISTHFVHI